MHLGVDFPKSHRLDRLADLLPGAASPGFDVSALTELAPWAVAGRYPENIENPTKNEARRLLELAREAVYRAQTSVSTT